MSINYKHPSYNNKNNICIKSTDSLILSLFYFLHIVKITYNYLLQIAKSSSLYMS
jgi:hypothetical protein